MKPILTAIFLIIAAVAVYDLVTQYQDCKVRNGALVRGLFGYECIGGRP
jgi:hypothetical protein